jgi:hypothetical protein
MENTNFNKNYISTTENTQTGMKVILVVAFLINLILSGALEYMSAWLNSLQMIIHLPML